jgi:outer membrane receptor protein involved in Fe transport
VARTATAQDVGPETVAPPAAETGPTATYTDEVVVAATRRAERAGELPVSVSVITAERLAGNPGAAQLDSALETEVPGFSLTRPGLAHPYASAGNRGVSLRGLGVVGGSRTLVLLDGIPLTDPLQGGVDWSRVALDEVERVEAVRTASGAVWGNLAMGGVIEVVTREPERRRAFLSAEGGELGLFAGSASLSERRGRHGLLLSARGRDLEGYFPQLVIGPVDRPYGIEERGAAGAWSFDGGIGNRYEASADWSSALRGRGTRLTSEVAEQVTLRLGASRVEGRSLWEGRIYGQRQQQASRRGAPNAARTAEVPSSDQHEIPARVAGASLQWSREGSARHLLTVGADASWIEAEVDESFRWVGDRFTRARGFGGATRTLGAFARETFRPVPRWSVHLGARLDTWRLSDGWRDQRDLETGALIARQDFAARSRTEISPSLGVVYQALPATALRLSVFSGFRAPTLFDLYRPGRGGSAGVIEANPEVGPERLKGAEAGINLRPAPAWSLDVAAYWNVVDDPIVQRTIGIAGPAGSVIPPCGAVAALAACRQKDNLGELRSRGLETTLAWDPTPRWSLRIHHVLADSVVTAAPGEPELVGKDAVQAPRHAAALSVSWADRRWFDGRLQARYLDNRFQDDRNDFPLEDYLYLDAQVSRELGAATVFVRVSNLLDERPIVERDASVAEPGPPRQASVGLRLTLPN